MTITGNGGPMFHLICVGITSNNEFLKESFTYYAEKLHLQYVSFATDTFLQHSLEAFWPPPLKSWSLCFCHLLLFSCPQWLDGKCQSSQLLSFTPQGKTPYFFIYLQHLLQIILLFFQIIVISFYPSCPLEAQQNLKNNSNKNELTLI